MAFNPLLPVNHSEIEAPELRGQFTGLFDLIQTIPVGPQGFPGPPGVEAVAVDGVTTGNPGASAEASATLLAGTLYFSFSLPRGDVGATGNTGADGGIGPVGPTGPPFTSFVIDSVTSLDSALPATVTAVFDGTNVKLAFGIPSGQRGGQGEQGTAGSTGPTGATGPAFTSFVIESVTMLDPFSPPSASATFDGTNVKLAFNIPRGFPGDAGATGATGATGPAGPQDLSDTARNPPTALLSLAVAGSYDQSEVQRIADKVDELITALRRV